MTESNFDFIFNRLGFGGCKNFFLLAHVFFLYSCSAFEGKQKTNVNEIIKTQEIKQLSQADVMLAAQLFGESVLKEINASSIACDSSKFKAFLDSLAVTFQGRVTFGRSQDNFLLKEEKDLFEAYQYNINQDVKSKNAIQMVDSKTAIYSVPFFNSRYCESQISQDSSSLTMLSIVYPTKSAINNMD